MPLIGRSPRAAPLRIRQRRLVQIHALLSAQHLNKVLHIHYDPTRDGADRLHYEIDAAALAHLQTELYGKRILITDRSEWSDEQILLAYRGQSEVEEAFRQLKDDEHMARAWAAGVPRLSVHVPYSVRHGQLSITILHGP